MHGPIDSACAHMLEFILYAYLRGKGLQVAAPLPSLLLLFTAIDCKQARVHLDAVNTRVHQQQACLARTRQKLNNLRRKDERLRE